MAQILAIDYGKKRTGIAVTDSLQIIASALITVDTKELFAFLCSYITENKIEILVVGLPKNLANEMNEIEEEISLFLNKIKNTFPTLQIKRVDERFTSKIASHTIFNSGMGKKKRQDKSLLDQVSATLILQSYLTTKS